MFVERGRWPFWNSEDSHTSMMRSSAASLAASAASTGEILVCLPWKGSQNARRSLELG